MAKIVKTIIRSNIWSIRLVPKNLMPTEGALGFCHMHRCAIDVQDDLDRQTTSIVLTHELAHAFLMMAGQFDENSFRQESVCDFIAWNADELIAVRDKVMKQWFDGHDGEDDK